MSLKSRTPAGLLQAAIEQGLDEALDKPLMDWLGSSILSPRPRGVLQALAVAQAVTTPRDLLETQRIWQALGGSISPVVLDDLAEWLAKGRGLRADPAMPPVRGALEALRAWAEERHVAKELDKRAAVLDDRVVGRARYWFWRRPQATIAEALTALPSRDPDAVPTEIQDAAQDWLAERAERVQRALLDERSLLASLKAPENGPLRELFDRVAAARATVRALTTPAPRDEAARVRVEALDDPPRWTVRDGWGGICEGGRGNVTLALQSDTLMSCSCGEKAQCSLGLLALDALAVTLSDPRSESHRWLAEVLAKAPWERLLDDLAAPAEEPITLGWRLLDERYQVVPMACTPKKRGGGWKMARLAMEDLASHPEYATTPQDRDARDLLLAAQNPAPPWIVETILCRLVGHPRFSIDSTPTSITRGTLHLDWEVADGGLVATVKLGSMVLDLEEAFEAMQRGRHTGHAILSVADGLVVAPVSPSLMRVVEGLERRGTRFPAAAVGPLLDRLPGMAVDVRLAPELRGDVRRADATPVIRIDTSKDGGITVTVVIRPMYHGPAFPPGEGPRWVYTGTGQDRVAIERDLDAEPGVARGAVADLPLPAEEGPFWWVIPDPEAALDVVHALASSALTVEWVDPGRRRSTSMAGAGSLRVAVRRSRDWLEVDGSVQVDGATVALSEVLTAVLAGRRYVAADANTWVRLSDELRAHVGAVAAAGGAQMPVLAAPLIESLREAGSRVDDDVATRTLLERARTSRDAEITVPEALNAELRPYQVEGFRWLARLSTWAPGACLADDMGLGKTVQAIALLLHRPGPALVVAPTSVGFNWLRELARFAPSLRARALRGAGRLDQLEDLGPPDVLVTSWDLLARDIDTLEKITFGTIVLDEAQAMKNPTTARARAAVRLDGAFRLALTGTPVENRVSELWSLFRVVAPGLLGSWDRFRERFLGPIERDGDHARRDALARLIRPFVLRRLKAMVAAELPPRTDVNVEVELSEEERRLYEATRIAAVASLQGAPDQRRFQVLAALTRLRQAACHPRLLDPESDLPSAKLTRLRELIGELRAEGHRALVFSQFTRHLALVRDALSEDGVRLRYLDGETPEARRRAEVDAFQAGDGDVFLISLKAGGVGLNLTAASYVFHLDPWWNPAVEDQASDRAHRIGQTLPVTVCRLVATGTIEDRILALHAEKRELVAGLLDGTGDGGPLSVEELMGLLE